MSAFIVDKVSIDLLVSAALDSVQGQSQSQFYYYTTRSDLDPLRIRVVKAAGPVARPCM